MDDDRKAQLIRDWIAFYQKQSPAQHSHNTELPEFWAVMELDDAAHEDPELAWSLILELLSTALPQNAYGSLAAGPLEDLIESHGNAFIDRIEGEARANPQFRHLLGGVWEGGPPDVWARVVEARGQAW